MTGKAGIIDMCGRIGTTGGTAQKTIIALWGISDLGKTTTIRLTYEELDGGGRPNSTRAGVPERK